MRKQRSRRSLRFNGLFGCMLLLCVAAPNGVATADDLLREQIDAAIAAEHEGPFAAPASDAEILRRLYLDLTGTIPTAEQARQFIDDPTDNKRARLVDRLLESPQFSRHMQTVFDVMLMERRADTHIPADQWREYLRSSFADGKPLNDLAAELIASDGLDPATRPAAKFFLDREGETNLVTRDISRLFFGLDLQCAQCHDHPLVGDYTQQDYYGLYAFLSRSFVFKDKSDQVSIAERAEEEVTYQSVFIEDSQASTGPRLPGRGELNEPGLVESTAYIVPPDDGVRPEPKHSRRARLAELLAAGEIEQFNTNLANRLWAHMLGRGLVHPLHQHHSDNPPSHPALLERLTAALAHSDFDMRYFLREIALSQTYQRSSELPADADPEALPPEDFALAALRPLTPEQLGWSVLQATGVTDNYRQQARNTQAADPRLSELLAADPERQALADRLIEENVYASLSGSLSEFVRLFGGLPGTPQIDSEATVHQALFVSNGASIQSWLQPSGHNLAARLQPLDDPGALADELYLSVLSRRPTPDEAALVAEQLAARPAEERGAATLELIWGLLASVEFRFNH